MDVDIKQLKKDLIEIYEDYLKDPNNQSMKDKAEEINSKYLNAMPFLDENMRYAINLLVNLYVDLESPGKPSKEVVEELLKKLKTDSN